MSTETEKTTVKRRDINIYEETGREEWDGTKVEPGWYATFNGRTSTGEYISFGRRDGTVQGALAKLEAEITGMGWEIAA